MKVTEIDDELAIAYAVLLGVEFDMSHGGNRIAAMYPNGGRGSDGQRFIKLLEPDAQQFHFYSKSRGDAARAALVRLGYAEE